MEMDPRIRAAPKPADVADGHISSVLKFSYPGTDYKSDTRWFLLDHIHMWEGKRWLFSLIILVQCSTSDLGPVAGSFPSVTRAREEEKVGGQGQLENLEILSRDQINNTSNA